MVYGIYAPEPEHGTYTRYNSRKWRCRCEPCKEANRVYMAELRAAKRGADAPPPQVNQYTGDSKHGTRGRYVRGCRCAPCRKANRIYQQSYMANIYRPGVTSSDFLPDDLTEVDSW